MSESGIVFDIQKFSIHDGPGIRTTVFLKGCPLRCLWCHNPESQSARPELLFSPEKCIGCGYCFKACPNQAHKMKDGLHIIDRSLCVSCGKCTEECYCGANSLAGKTMSVEAVMDEVLKDKPFYVNSGGGMTLSGGEPMNQFEFSRELLRSAKQNGLHTCMETCGFASAEHFLTIVPLVDLFLFDLKETDPLLHHKYTGVLPDRILENLHVIDNAGAKCVLRCPIIPGLNDREDHFRNIGRIAETLSNLSEINIMPYHPLGDSKLARLGREFSFQSIYPDELRVRSWIGAVQQHTSIPVSLA